MCVSLSFEGEGPCCCCFNHALVAFSYGPEWLFVLGFVFGVLGCLISSRLSTCLQDTIVLKLLQCLLGKHCKSPVPWLSGDIRADDIKTTSASSPLMVMK